jgi:Asp-tRNA(Asn)/Glu-tRNA(Gln) amidotransferase A subunit family amidase
MGMQTNCLAFIMFDQALKDAAALDSYMSVHHKPIGPLHGLPISVKEHIHFANTPATSGFVAWADQTSQVDALIVKTLRDAGAVFHCKTTNPQALMVNLAYKRLRGFSDQSLRHSRRQATSMVQRQIHTTPI